MKVKRSIISILIVLGLALGGLGMSTALPVTAIADDDISDSDDSDDDDDDDGQNVLYQTFRTVRRAYRRGHIEATTYEELRGFLRDARRADQESQEYHAAIQNFRLLISAQTGLTISIDAAVRLFQQATDL